MHNWTPRPEKLANQSPAQLSLPQNAHKVRQIITHLLSSLRKRFSRLTPPNDRSACFRPKPTKATIQTFQRAWTSSRTLRCELRSRTQKIEEQARLPSVFKSPRHVSYSRGTASEKHERFFTLTCETGTTSSAPRLAARSIASGPRQPLQKEDRHDAEGIGRTAPNCAPRLLPVGSPRPLRCTISFKYDPARLVQPINIWKRECVENV